MTAPKKNYHYKTIAMSEGTKQLLDSMKLHARETYEQELVRLLGKKDAEHLLTTLEEKKEAWDVKI